MEEIEQAHRGLLGLIGTDIREGKYLYDDEEMIAVTQTAFKSKYKSFHCLNVTVISTDKEIIDTWAKTVHALQGKQWSVYDYEVPERTESKDNNGPV